MKKAKKDFSTAHGRILEKVCKKKRMEVHSPLSRLTDMQATIVDKLVKEKSKEERKLELWLEEKVAVG